jgi:hypothetical protein
VVSDLDERYAEGAAEVLEDAAYESVQALLVDRVSCRWLLLSGHGFVLR